MSHVDFVSFSVKLPDVEFENDLQARPHMYDAVWEAVGDGVGDWIRQQGKLEKGKKHRPFSAGVGAKNISLSIMWNYRLSHGVVELGGTACSSLRQAGLMDELLEAVRDSVVRLDIATDLATETDPEEFIGAGMSARFKSSGIVRSGSGVTCYVGSRKSERYARVYRYSAPHPRSALLRVEYELKGVEARRGVDAVLTIGVDAAALALGEVFGWQHPLWKTVGVSTDELPPSERVAQSGNTVRWLYDTIAPLIVRLHREGTIDAVQFFWSEIVDKLSE